MNDNKSEIEKRKSGIKCLFRGNRISFDLRNGDGEGIVLDTVYKDKENLCIYEIYKDLTADTQFGRIDLKRIITDEDDWDTLEDTVTDLVM